ncbi:MAG: hypothetical protein NVS2B5_10260 [Beijerinckiaceae bacterium]
MQRTGVLAVAGMIIFLFLNGAMAQSASKQTGGSSSSESGSTQRGGENTGNGK